MKRILTTCLALSLCLLFAQNVYAQERSCGTDHLMEDLLKDPEYKQKHEAKLRRAFQIGNKVADFRDNCDNGTIVIPMAVHYQGIRGQYDAPCLIELAQRQIDILNADYQGTNTDINKWLSDASSFPGTSNGEACIQFCLATSNHPSGVGLIEGQPAVTFNEFKRDRARGFEGYINIFVRNIQYLGYSPLGGSLNGDGVVIDNNAFGNGSGCGSFSPGAPYNLGRTLTHELGHYLMLPHIWGGGCGSDDGIGDTPDSEGPYYSCPPLGASTCGSTDMHMNYMDYVDDECMYMFSALQTDVMYDYAAGLPFKQGTCGGGNNDPTCEDEIQNGDETGVDCGGPDCPACPPVACDAPANLNYTSQAKGKRARLSWSVEASAQSYEVQIIPAGGSFPAAGSGEITSNTNITFRVTAGNSYEWRVRANCGGGEYSDWTSSSFTAARLGRLSSNFEEVSMFPNPASQTINVSLELFGSANAIQELKVIREDNNTFTEPVQLAVLDLTGRTISTQKVNNNENTELNISNLTPGMYFIRVDYEGLTSVKKFVVKH